jgi:hypothetical protein
MALGLVHGSILFHFPACGHYGVILWEARYAAVVSFCGKRGMRLWCHFVGSVVCGCGVILWEARYAAENILESLDRIV